MPWQELKSALGMAKGGPLRNALDQLWGAFGIEKSPAQSRVAFTIAVITLAAKMSKADGVSSEIEAEVFDRVYVVPDSERANVTRLFQLASQDVAGYEIYARQIAGHLEDEPEVKASVLECLFHIACADGVLHPAEHDFLGEVARIFGIRATEFQSIRRAFVHDPDGPFEILGLAPDATDQQIKARYLELVKMHHPDGLISKGVPPEFLIAAERRLAAVTTAYEAIQLERGKRAPRALEGRS
ncbi:MAG: TerB family tellurite resistance protein [Hyphomicrobium sp.]|nr:DnaJ domain-containing protein [Hyphomicrobium sp.]